MCVLVDDMHDGREREEGASCSFEGWFEREGEIENSGVCGAMGSRAHQEVAIFFEQYQEVAIHKGETDNSEWAACSCRPL